MRYPTGDGMALVFRDSPESPAQCALEIADALRKHPEISVRMGIHSGPVSEVTDVTGAATSPGAGINMAQRVMDCGDAGHILLSNTSRMIWRNTGEMGGRDLHDLRGMRGETRRPDSVVNLYADRTRQSRAAEKYSTVAATAPVSPPDR